MLECGLESFSDTGEHGHGSLSSTQIGYGHAIEEALDIGCQRQLDGGDADSMIMKKRQSWDDLPGPNGMHGHKKSRARAKSESDIHNPGPLRPRTGSFADELQSHISEHAVMENVPIVIQMGLEISQRMHGSVGGNLAGKIGDNIYIVGIAENSRSKCSYSGCRQCILEGQLRLGKRAPSLRTGHNIRAKWYHPECIFQSFQRTLATTKTITTTSEIYGFAALDQDEKQQIEKLLTAYLDPSPSDVSSPLSSPKTGATTSATPSSPPPPEREAPLYVASTPDCPISSARFSPSLSNLSCLLDPQGWWLSADYWLCQSEPCDGVDLRAAGESAGEREV